tara:strand:+ start:249 stop:371 length:123 start_codon:yes stop_codon:yes gene_type:complete
MDFNHTNISFDNGTISALAKIEEGYYISLCLVGSNELKES